MKFVYGWGAAAIIAGLFKLCTGRFPNNACYRDGRRVLCSFCQLNPHEEVDWTLVYPELAGMTDNEPVDRADRDKDIRTTAYWTLVTLHLRHEPFDYGQGGGFLVITVGFWSSGFQTHSRVKV